MEEERDKRAAVRAQVQARVEREAKRDAREKRQQARAYVLLNRENVKLEYVNINKLITYYKKLKKLIIRAKYLVNIAIINLKYLDKICAIYNNN